jgi:hypothetical protein
MHELLHAIRTYVEERHHGAAAWAASQPHEEWVSAGVRAALEHPVEQVGA